MEAVVWTTPIYHSQANLVERHKQDLKKGLRALLANDKQFVGHKTSNYPVHYPKLVKWTDRFPH